MKKFSASSFLDLIALASLCAVLFSFGTKGGDVFEIYLNGKRVCQQFVYVAKNAKTLELFAANDNDKIDVSYLHCGRVGTKRMLSFRNEKAELVKQLKFADASDNHSFMSFYRRDVAKDKNTRLNVYYTSSELPEGRLLATLSGSGNQSVAKR